MLSSFGEEDFQRFASNFLTAGMKRGRHAKTWSVCNAHNVRHVFLQKKNKLAGKQAQNNNNKNIYSNFSDITNRFSPIIREKNTKLLSRQKSACSKMAPRMSREMRAHEWSRDRLLRRGVAVKDLKGPDKHNALLGLSFS